MPERLVGALVAILMLAACVADPAPSPDAITTPSGVPSASRSPEIPAEALDGIEADDAAVILETALDFEPTRAVHEGRRYAVSEIEAVDGATFGGIGLYARVVIEFRDPIPYAAGGWPDEAVCDMNRESNDITGIAWLRSFETEAVEVYSPQWDYAIACT